MSAREPVSLDCLMEIIREHGDGPETERAVAEMVAQARRDALTDLVDDWQWGGWADALMGRNIQERLRNARPVTDWLRERAAREDDR